MKKKIIMVIVFLVTVCISALCFIPLQYTLPSPEKIVVYGFGGKNEKIVITPDEKRFNLFLAVARDKVQNMRIRERDGLFVCPDYFYKDFSPSNHKYFQFFYSKKVIFSIHQKALKNDMPKDIFYNRIFNCQELTFLVISKAVSTKEWYRERDIIVNGVTKQLGNYLEIPEPIDLKYIEGILKK